MKFPGQTKDGVIDNLLRAYVSRPSNPRQACPDFDPDQANSYIEHNLTGASRARYEQHLSECAPCRKNVVALVRLAEAEGLISGSPELSRSGWFDSARRVFGAMSQPQWAMAAAAVIVLAISLPLVLSHNWNRQESAAVVSRAPSENPKQALTPELAQASPKSAEAASVSTNSTAEAIPKERSRRENDALAVNAAPTAKPSDAAARFGDVAEPSKKVDTASAATKPAEELTNSELQVAKGLPQGGAAPSPQLAKNEVAKNDSDQGRQQPEKDSAQQAKDAKARADEDSNQKQDVGKGEAAVAPPALVSSPQVNNSRGTLRRSAPKLSLRDNSGGETVRADERKISGKKFLFKDGAWTDKDFNPDKDLPVVTIFRDSNTYKEVISKRAGLRSIMERFSVAERAIIVYKGTVYVLVPPQSDK